MRASRRSGGFLPEDAHGAAQEVMRLAGLEDARAGPGREDLVATAGGGLAIAFEQCHPMATPRQEQRRGEPG
jgi:hypothetical protein